MKDSPQKNQEIELYKTRIFPSDDKMQSAFLKLSNRPRSSNGTKLNQHRLIHLSSSDTPNKTPFDYQRELIRGALSAVRAGRRRQMLSMPTGAGKTATAVWLIHELILELGLIRVLWLAPSTELVKQAADAFAQTWSAKMPDASLEIHDITSTAANPDAIHIAVTTIQQLLHRRHAVQAFSPQVVVFDEAHQAAAPRFRQALEQAVNVDSAVLIGLSATPGRGNSSELFDLSILFDEQLAVPAILGPRPIDYLRSIGVYASINFDTIDLGVSADYLSVSDREQHLPTHELCSHPKRFWPTIDRIAAATQQAPIIVFASSVVHSYAIQVALANRRIRSRTLSYRTPSATREEIIRLFKAGELLVLLNVAILNTGFDFPELSQVAVTAPVRSSVLWEQIVGRVARGPAVGGTKQATVYQVDRHDIIHGQLQSYARFWGGSWN